MIRNSSSGSQKDEMQLRKSLSDQVDPSKEQGPENASGIRDKYSILQMKFNLRCHHMKVLTNIFSIYL